jgi:hypothetical protein
MQEHELDHSQIFAHANMEQMHHFAHFVKNHSLVVLVSSF